MQSLTTYFRVLILFLLTITFCQGQSALQKAKTRSLITSAIDESGHPIAMGNVLVLSTLDSSMIKGVFFTNGQIKLENLPPESMLVRITALGYQDHWLSLSEANRQSSLIELAPIQLAAFALEGVEVIARQQILEQKGSDLIVHVAQTPLSETGSAMDLLQNIPKVLLTRNGQVTILGKGTAFIYLDGQRIASTQILGALSSNDIKRIEVLEQPSAKYEASGNAVINIITKGKSLEGYKIGLVQRFGKGKHYRSFFQANGYYKINK